MNMKTKRGKYLVCTINYYKIALLTRAEFKAYFEMGA